MRCRPLSTLLLAAASAQSAASLSPISLGVYLMVDDELIASSTNVSFALGTPVKQLSSPVVVPEHQWERSIGFYTSALTCPPAVAECGTGWFALYYVCRSSLTTQSVTLCLANSTDGLVWSKPLLPLFRWNGSAVVPSGAAPDGLPTNAVFQTDDPVSFPGSVALDTAAGVPGGERFKLTYEGGGPDGSLDRYLYLASSPDGLNWTKRSPETPIIAIKDFSDTQTAMVVDPSGPSWTVFGRRDATSDNDTTLCAGAYPALRRVMAAVSNTSAWGPYGAPVEIISPGDPDSPVCLDDYNPAPIVSDGVTFLQPSNFLHFPEAQSGGTGNESRINDGVQDIRLAYARGTGAAAPAAVSSGAAGRRELRGSSAKSGGLWTAPAGSSGAKLAPLNFSFSAGRGAFIPRGMGYRDPASGSYNVSGSDADAGFVFATAGGMIDRDVLAPPPSRRARGAGAGRGGTTKAMAWRAAISSSNSSEALRVDPRGTAGAAGGWPFPFSSPSPTVSLLYWGSQGTHTGSGDHYPLAFQGVLRATLRREGFVKLQSPLADPWSLAAFVTVPLSLPDPASACSGPGEELWLLLNAETSVGGWVLVELRDPDSGEALPGYAFADATPVAVKGNAVRIPVGWARPQGREPPAPIAATFNLGPPSQNGARPLSLAFQLKHAAIYALDLQCVASS